MRQIPSLGIIFFSVVSLGLLVGCSSGEDDLSSAFIDGTISVSDDEISIGDYSGIEVTIIQRDSANADADTLYYQVTDSSGYFSGIAQFADKRFYTLLIDRDMRRLVQRQIILADADSIHIEGILPDLQANLTIHSNEHDALDKFARLTNGYQRVLSFIQAGVVRGDSIVTEMDKWGALYWDLYLEEQGTIAGNQSASEAVRIFRSINDGPVLMEKLEQLRSDQDLLYLAARYGAEYLARTRGLDYTLGYLDTLQTLSETNTAGIAVYRERIELLYDSARIDQAREELALLRENYELNRSVNAWAESMEYDLNYLSPGNRIPEFSFQSDGQVISRDSLMGSPYILEITLLSNLTYQNEFDRTSVIHNIYGNHGLQIVTIPLDQSQVTVDAFFEERNRAWPVAPANAFDNQELLTNFNIQTVPTWFLVDREGEIVRKYVGQEYVDIIRGLQTIINTEEAPS